MLNGHALHVHNNNKNKSISDRNDRGTIQTRSQRTTHTQPYTSTKTLKPQPVDMPCDCVTQNTANANCEILFFPLFQTKLAVSFYLLGLFLIARHSFERYMFALSIQEKKTGSVEIRMPLK